LASLEVIIKQIYNVDVSTILVKPTEYPTSKFVFIVIITQLKPFHF